MMETMANPAHQDFYTSKSGNHSQLLACSLGPVCDRVGEGKGRPVRGLRERRKFLLLSNWFVRNDVANEAKGGRVALNQNPTRNSIAS